MKQLLLRELDYTIEARNAQRFRQNFAAEGRVYMPRVFWESSTRNVLTLEYREGISLNRYLEQPLLQPPPQKVAAILADVFFKQIFVDGFFHGDPHPGNIAVLPDGRLFFMDFGSAGHISETVRGKFIAIARALQGYDSAAAVDELLGLAFVPPVINRLELIRDLDELLEDYFELPLQNIVISEAIRRLMQVAVKHRLRFPHELTLLARAVVTLEGTVSRLDPEFSLADAARKYALELQRRQLKLELRRFRSAWRGYRRLFEEFPEQAKEILRASAAGELKLKLELPQRAGDEDGKKHGQPPQLQHCPGQPHHRALAELAAGPQRLAGKISPGRNCARWGSLRRYLVACVHLSFRENVTEIAGGG